jgi:hypothetical protein
MLGLVDYGQSSLVTEVRNGKQILFLGFPPFST